MPVAPLSRIDHTLVRVELVVGRGRRVRLGAADVALRDKRLGRAERRAIAAMVRAVHVLRERAGEAAGLRDARAAITLVLRDPEATQGGPWADARSVSVGRTNALAGRTSVPARRGVLLPTDVAIHELAHVIQLRRMAGSDARPHSALLEGVADAVAMLATADTLLGEEYFVATGARDAVRGAIRDLDPASRARRVETIGGRLDTLASARAPTAEPHDAGALVSRIFVLLAQRLGRTQAEDVLWRVIGDDAAWATGGSWGAFADAVRAAAETAGPRATDAVDHALTTVGFPAPATA